MKTVTVKKVIHTLSTKELCVIIMKHFKTTPGKAVVSFKIFDEGEEDNDNPQLQGVTVEINVNG